MTMTATEIHTNVLTRWDELDLGASSRALGWYLAAMQTRLTKIAAAYNESTPAVSSDMLWVLTQVWALLRWRGDLPIVRSWAYKDPIYGEPPPGIPPSPQTWELDSYPLEITGITWTPVRSQDYAMLATTYADELAVAWKLDPETLWTDTSTDAARHLFEVCKQYLLRHGIAD